MSEIVLRVHELTKSFGGIEALKGVSLDVTSGEILSLVGENGAGKSTLAKIVAGVIPRDSGLIEFNGKAVSFRNTTEARKAGVAIVLQEFNLIPHLSVAENIFLTSPEAYASGIWLRREEIEQRTARLFERMHLDFYPDPGRKVTDLSIAEQQFVEIVKAVAVDAKLLIFDEPTATLSQEAVAKLFGLIRTLRDHGVTIVFVSHRIEEVFSISDRIVVFRDGEKIREFTAATTTSNELITCMVGRDIGDMYAVRKRRPPGETVLEVDRLSRPPRFHDCSFRVRRGEVVGISGLVGAGRTELLRAIFGADAAHSGSVSLRGRPGHLPSPTAAIRRGLAMVPEDRKAHGIFLQLPVYQNITLALLAKRGRFWISRKREERLVDAKLRELRIKTPSPKLSAGALSGGNQQKTVLAKWLLTEPGLLMLDEPTRGIDIGAKFEVYTMIDALAAEGMAILLVSSELPEIIALSDRILVMNRGRIVKEMDHAEASEESLLSYSAQLPAGGHSHTLERSRK